MQTTPVAWPLAEGLDAYLNQVVVTLREATERGIRKVHERPVEAERTIGECMEILDVILAGEVEAWVGG